MTRVARSVHDKLPHPGEAPLQVGIKPIHLNDLVAGRRPVDVDSANRFGGFTGTRARFWLDMQAAADYGAAHGA